MEKRTDKIRVLIISGFLCKEHNYVDIDQNLRTLLKSTGRFTVKVTEDFRGSSAETLENYDLVLMNYDGKDWINDPTAHYWGENANKALFDFVRNGGGIVFYHSSAAVYPETPEEYRQIMGMGLDLTDGARKNPSKDDFIVDVRTNHPITAGLKPHFMTTGDDFIAGLNVYGPAENIEVLATVFDAVEDYMVPGFPPAHTAAVKIPAGGLSALKGINTDTPVMWTNRYGKGRAFVVTIGHEMDTLRRMEFLTLLVRGCEWAATGEVTLDPPDRKGENRLSKWPYYGGYHGENEQ